MQGEKKVSEKGAKKMEKGRRGWGRVQRDKKRV